MLVKLGQKLLWAAAVVFVLIPSMIAGMNKAEAQMMLQIRQISIKQIGQPSAAIQASTVPQAMQPLVLTRR